MALILRFDSIIILPSYVQVILRGKIMEYINLITSILFWLIIIQGSTITHELGHAIWGLIYTKEKVVIELGRKTEKPKLLKLGRLDIYLGSFDPFSGFTYVNTEGMKKYKKLLFYIGGPLMSLVIAIALFFIKGLVLNKFLNNMILLSSYYHFYQFLVTMFPMVYPRWWGVYGGYSSDGYKFLTQLIGRKNSC